MTNELAVRPARADDRDAVIEITREVWEGTDYVPFVWHDWLYDARGALLVAEEAGKVVGLQHQYVQNDGDAWLEGIRVAPDRRGNGIAENLLREGLKWARLQGCTTARLTASSENPASNRLALSAGFLLLQQFEPLIAEPAQQMSDSVRVAHPTDFERVQDIVRDGLHGDAPFLLEGWTANRWNPLLVRRLLGMQAVIVGADMPCVAVVTCRHPFSVVRIAFSLGLAHDIECVAWAARSAAFITGLSEVRAMALVGSPMLDGLEAGGFRPQHEFRTNLYELSLTNLPVF